MYSNLLKIYTFFISIFILTLISVHEVLAEVVINEINPSGEWIELFKTTEGPHILEGCTLYFQDSKSQKRDLVSSDNFLETDYYKVITTNGNFLSNSSTDTVILECPSVLAQSEVYPDNVNDKSYARVPNGTGSFEMMR